MAEDNRGTLGAAAEPAAAADQARQAPPDPATETAAPPPDGGQGPDDGRYIENDYIFSDQLSPNKGVMDEERRKDFTPAQNAIIDAVYEFQLSLLREIFITSETTKDIQGNYFITWPKRYATDQEADQMAEQSKIRNAKEKALAEKLNLAEPESTSIFDIFRKFVPVQDAEEELRNITEAAFLRAMQEVGEAAKAAQATTKAATQHKGLEKKRQSEAAKKAALAEATRELFAPDYRLLANADMLNSIFSLDTHSMKPDEYGEDIKTQEFENGTVKVKGLETNLTTSALMLWDAAVLQFTQNNYTGTSANDYSIAAAPNTTIILDLKEYAKARGRGTTEESLKLFRKEIRKDIEALSNITVSGDITKGKKKGHFIDMGYITKAAKFVNGSVLFYIDPEMAKYLANAPVTVYPPVIQKIDGRNPNAYQLARWICVYSSMQHNQNLGKDCTIGIESLIAHAPKIPNIETLLNRGQRNWKQKIKEPLDKALQAITKSGYIIKWEYYNPRTSQTYTPEEADNITTWEEYRELKINYTLMEDETRLALKRPKNTSKGG